MLKCAFNFIEITLPHGYSSINVLHLCSRTPFFWRTASVYCSKYRGYKCRGFLSAGKKLFEIHFKIMTTFSNFIHDFRLVAKGQFSEAVEVVNKTRNLFIRLWYLNCNLKLYIRQAANFAQNVIYPQLLSINCLEGRI